MTSGPIRFLSVANVMQIQADTIAHEGGMAGVREHGLLEAAVMMPQQQFGGQCLHDGIPAMAAALLFHVAMNHPFHDGNKRAAVMSALVFLDANGVTDLPDEDAFEAVTMAVASSSMDKAALTAWFEANIKPPE